MSGTSSIKTTNNTIELEIPLVTYKRGEIHICYCPVLELMTYSEDESKLDLYFDEVLEHFIMTQTEKKTLHDTLINLGWTIKKEEIKKPQKPIHAGMLRNKSISIPAMAC